MLQDLGIQEKSLKESDILRGPRPKWRVMTGGGFDRLAMTALGFLWLIGTLGKLRAS
jgi:hypothetical protein